MAVFGSIFAESLASKRFLRAPEGSENLVNSIVDSISNLPNDIPLNFWPSEEASLESKIFYFERIRLNLFLSD